MAPKTVSKKTYYIITLLFYSFCLSGLLWQVEQISENFFQFDTIKDINVFRPEEMNETVKIFYFCGDYYDLINVHKYNMVLFGKATRTVVSQSALDKMSFKDKFNVTYQADQMFSTSSKNIDEFMYDEMYCFAFHPSWRVYLYEDRPSWKETFHVSIGHRKYQLDKERLIRVAAVKNDPQYYRISSNSYHLLKLPSPYTDQCFSYKGIGKMDQKDAISDCLSNETSVYFEKILWKKNSNHNNKTVLISSHTKKQECSNLYSKLDCDSMIYLTKISSEDHDRIIIEFLTDTEVSFQVLSLPRIDTINYITYILGAMGSWIGFSFIGINPIPYFIKKSENAVEPLTHGTCTFKSILLTQRLNQTNQELVSTKNRLDQTEQQMNETKQQMNDQSIMIQELKSNLEQVLRQ